MIAPEAIKSKKYQLIVLDEIILAVGLGLLEIKEIVDLIKKTPLHQELVLTGRAAPEKIIQTADLVTEMKNIRHPFNQGISAVRGIDY